MREIVWGCADTVKGGGFRVWRRVRKTKMRRKRRSAGEGREGIGVVRRWKKSADVCVCSSNIKECGTMAL
jgi:hypothetical protein